MRMSPGLKTLVAFCAVPALLWAAEDPAKAREAGKNALGKTKVAMSAALETAQKEAKDGKAIECELELQGDKPVFEVAFMTGDKRTEVFIDGVTGTKGATAPTGEHKHDATEMANAKKALGLAKVTLSAALETAVKEAKDGKAYKGALTMDADKPIFHFEMMVGDKFMSAQIDAVSGKVIKVEEQKMETKKPPAPGG